MNVLDLAQKHVRLRKVASTKGGEWQGACPWCGGNNRFHVWPEQNVGRGTYWCRSCGKGGDAIKFLRDHDGMTFKEACDYLNIKMDEKKEYTKPDIRPHEYQPREPQTPSELWQAKAEKFTSWAQEQLRQNADILSWLSARGITPAAAAKYRLGWNPGEEGKDIYRHRKAWGLPEIIKENGKPKALWLPIGLVIPQITDGAIQRIRIRRPEGDPRYYILPGSSSATMILEEKREAFVVVESELDAIAGASSGELAGAVATGSLEGKPDAAAFSILKNAKQILNALDFGDEGGGKEAAKRAIKWWSEHFPKTNIRWPVPQGKDPGEAYQMGIDLEMWIKKGLWPVVLLAEKKAVPSIAPARENATADKPAPPSEQEMTDIVAARGLSPEIAELCVLLRRNPTVRIINTQERFSIMRGDKPGAGGRIQQLVLSVPSVMDYILAHPAEVITWENIMGAQKHNGE
ncbi:MAG: CHC2 zinc finger domain-containing protein [Candidatus Omnitrophica bacterium]|nr:CHC2 zinc finger domain-containing protein [Candidatus Omnitrophota bacterium]